MAESDDILKLIQQLPPEEQAKLIQSLSDKEERKKVRRKHYKKKEQQNRRTPIPNKKKEQGYTNKFEKDPLFHANKQDAEIDKKLWANHQPIERDRPNALIDATCQNCGKTERISKTLLVRSVNEDGRLSEPTYKCNKCQTNRASRGF